MATKKTKITEVADAATEATADKSNAKKTCRVKVKALRLGTDLFGRGAIVCLASAEATKLAEDKKVTFVEEKK